MFKTGLLLFSGFAVAEGVKCALKASGPQLECTGGSVLDASKDCASASGCVESEFGDDSKHCCTNPVSCNTFSDGTCTNDAVKDTTAKCAAAPCVSGDFGAAATKCCTTALPCSGGSSAFKNKCTSNSLHEMDEAAGKVCAASPCKESDFANAAGSCCKVKADAMCDTFLNNAAFKKKCTDGGKNMLDAGKLCPQSPCVEKDFTGKDASCCKLKPAKCVETADWKCTGSAVLDSAKDCPAGGCVSNNFGAASTHCCTDAVACSGGSSAFKNKCTSNSLHEMDEAAGKFCAASPCKESDFANAAGKCCKVKAAAMCSNVKDAAIKDKCTSDPKNELDVTGKVCKQLPCKADDFTGKDANCCKAKAVITKAKCSEGDDAMKAKCAGANEPDLAADKECAAAACKESDFLNADAGCCKVKVATTKAKCSEGNDVMKGKCTGLNEPDVGADKFCAAAECKESDFASKDANCCKLKVQLCSKGTDVMKGKCKGLNEPDVGADKFCAGAECKESDFASKDANCCKAKTAKCAETTTLKCTAPATVVDKTKDCAAAKCATGDFGGVDKVCCKAAPKGSGAASVLPSAVLTAAGFLALY